jgi:hypothetical protein
MAALKCPSEAAIKLPTIIPETDNGKVLKRAASI